jgi:hypothetical protein
MTDQTWILQIVEQAERDEPTCMTCGAPTLAVGHEDGVWFECASLQQPKSRLSRIVSLDFASLHTHRLLIDPAA